MTSTQTRKPRETSAARAKREWEETMELALSAGYVSPFPQPWPGGTEEDRCEKCGWSLFVSMECAVYCPNERCTEHRRDLRDDVEEES